MNVNWIRQSGFKLIVALMLLNLLGCSDTGSRPLNLEIIDSNIPAKAMPSAEETVSEATSTKLMTMEDLQACATSIVSMRKLLTQLETDKLKLDQRKQEIAQQVQTNQAARLTINPRNTAQVSEFNKRLEQHRREVHQFNLDIKAYNIQVTELKKQDKDFNADCASRSYLNADFSQLTPELQAAITSQSPHASHTLERVEQVPSSELLIKAKGEH